MKIFRKKWGNRSSVRFSMRWCLLVLLAICHAEQSKAAMGGERRDEYTMLGLVGYNYTDRHISAYSIDGVDGGHINLSSPTSGGSGISCCVKFSRKNSGPLRVKIRWQVGGCTYSVKDEETGRSDKVRYYYYKEAVVEVQRIYETEPAYIEAHFFPNGSVQVRLTDHGSNPLLALSERRRDKSYFPQCKNDRNPDE